MTREPQPPQETKEPHRIEAPSAAAEFPENPLSRLLRILWHSKVILVAVMAVSILLWGFWVATRTPKYETSIVVSPNFDLTRLQSGGGSTTTVPGMLNRLAGDVFGIQQDDPVFERFIMMLGSMAVAEQLDAKYDLKKLVFGGLWNSGKQKWLAPTGFRAKVSIGLKSLLGLPEWQPPNVIDLTNALMDMVRIEHLGKGPARKIVIIHPNREFSAKLLGWLYQETVTVMRDEALLLTRSQIDLVERKFLSSTVSEHRTALASLLSELQRTEMLMAEGVPVGATLLQRPMSSNSITSPRLGQSLAFALLLGMAAGIALAHANYWRATSQMIPSLRPSDKS